MLVPHVQPYQPSLAAAWLFQRSMALRIGQLRAPRGRRRQLSGFLPPSHINRLLRANFRVMQVGCPPLRCNGCRFAAMTISCTL